ncbi:MAG: RNA polymerase sigma factor, partial [Myxococcota bacterium]
MSAEPPPHAFHAVYEQELSYVHHSLRRLGVPPKDADDLTQEVFVTAFQKFDAYDRARPLRPWLFGIAFRVASGFRNQVRHEREVPGELPELEDPGSAPDEAVAARQARELVLRALEPLHPDRKAIFILHDIDGCSVPQAAEALAVP